MMHPNAPRDVVAKLKNVTHKTVWGARNFGINHSNIVTINDHEYLIPIGSGLLHVENVSIHTRKTTMITTGYPEVEKINMMRRSHDNEYLATTVTMKNHSKNEMHIMIFYTKGHMTSQIRPRHIKYSTNAFVATGDRLQCTAMDFSHDGLYLACATNFPSIGAIIFDQLKGTVHQTISCDGIPATISFHPGDSGKLFVTGNANFVKFWRFTGKSVHVAPIIGLRKGNFNYTCQAWVQPYSENTVVVGTAQGFVCVVQNCEQRAPAHQAFGSAEHPDPHLHSVSQMVVRGDNVIVASPINHIVLYEIRRVVLSKGLAGLTATLFPLAQYRLNEIEHIYGLDFCLRASVTSYHLIVTTNNSVIQLEMISDHDLSGGNEHKARRMSLDSKDPENEGVWTPVDVEKYIYKFHSAGIQSMSVSTKGRVFLSTSFNDTSVRVWDFDDPTTFNSSWMIESFNDRAEENPFHADIHPSGLQIVTACESEVREYAVADKQIDLIRRFGVRTPFQSPNGLPVVISQPVSLVKYSNGGHLLAVVTGKTVQVFNMFRQDHETATSAGNPCRVMAMCDHVATVTDIAFLRDDSRMVTTSTDGSVYSWVMGGAGREKEYICKGISATHLAVTTHHATKTTIIASFEGQAETVNLAAEVVRKRRQSSIAMRSMSKIDPSLSRNISAPSMNNGSRNSSGQDFAAALMLFANGDAASRHSHSSEAPNSPKQQSKSKNNFIAIWENDIHANPVIAYIDVPVKSIAVGKSCGPDSNDLCVIGLADGRVLVSLLPIPLQQVVPTIPKATIHSTVAIAKVTGTLKLRRKSTLQGAMESVAEGSQAEPPSPSESHYSQHTPNKNASSTSVTSDMPEPMAPFSPAKSQSGFNFEDPSSPGPVTKSDGKVHLDENQCKVFRLFVVAVTHVAFSLDGQYIFAGGEDGTIHVLTTIKRVTEDLLKQQQVQEVPMNNSMQFLMMEKTKMQTLRSKLIELETTMEQGRKENEMYINKLLEGKERQFVDMETKLKREIQKREDTILAGRKEYLQMKRTMQDDIQQLKKGTEEALKAMELMYEKKLAQESVYLDKMKQAYDEFVVHSRMDMSNLQVEAEAKIRGIEQEKVKALHEAEKQKVAVLQYYDYVKARNDEVLQSLEEQQAEERTKLKVQLKDTSTMLAQSQAMTMSADVQASRTIKKLKVDIETKEMEVMRINSDIDWANDRIQKLEGGLEKATLELKARSELVEKWETKTMELTKKVDDLEKIRKTLTTQLNLVQGELNPKEHELVKATDRLQEMNREYEIALHAITEKEKVLNQRAENLALLQKQVRELRATAAQKDAALRRAAISLEDFVYAMNETRFKPLEGSSNDIFKVAEQRLYGKLDKKGNQLLPGGGNIPSTNGNATQDSANATANANANNNNSNNNNTGNANNGNSNQNQDPPKMSKKPSPHDGLLAALNLDPSSDHKLKRLHDILKPYMNEGGIDSEYVDEMEAVRREQERHVTILHKNIENLQSSMDSAHLAATAKVVNHLTDNQTLLNEVNNLRTEIKALSLENHRLSAMMEYQNGRKILDAHNANSLVLNSEIDERYVMLEKAGTTTTSTSRKSKKPPTYHQTKTERPSSPETYNPTPHVSYPPNTTLPKLNSSTQPLGDIPATNAAHNNHSIKAGNSSSSTMKKPGSKGVPTIEDLLGGPISSSGSMVKSSSDFLWKGKPNSNLHSHTAPLASPMPLPDKLIGSSNKSNNNNNNQTYSNAAERKIAAIVELNLQEIHKKPKSSH